MEEEVKALCKFRRTTTLPWGARLDLKLFPTDPRGVFIHQFAVHHQMDENDSRGPRIVANAGDRFRNFGVLEHRDGGEYGQTTEVSIQRPKKGDAVAFMPDENAHTVIFVYTGWRWKPLTESHETLESFGQKFEYSFWREDHGNRALRLVIHRIDKMWFDLVFTSDLDKILMMQNAFALPICEGDILDFLGGRLAFRGFMGRSNDHLVRWHDEQTCQKKTSAERHDQLVGHCAYLAEEVKRLRSTMIGCATALFQTKGSIRSPRLQKIREALDRGAGIKRLPDGTYYMAAGVAESAVREADIHGHIPEANEVVVELCK